MKGALDRTKVVLRHLPPSISEAALLAQIDAAFAGRYNWLSFRPGKIRFSFFIPILLHFIACSFLLLLLLLKSSDHDYARVLPTIFYIFVIGVGRSPWHQLCFNRIFLGSCFLFSNF